MTRPLNVVAHELGGKGPLLLILHANGFHGRVYAPMVPVFFSAFRCVALDLPGHGDAPEPNAPFSAEELVDAVTEFVNAHGIWDCYCFGHSLGGAMAALLELQRPGTFRAMFLFEPVLRPHEHLQPPAAPPVTAAVQRPLEAKQRPGIEPATARSGPNTLVPNLKTAGARPASTSAVTSGGVCSPSPSLAAPGVSNMSGPRKPSHSLLARMARKRQSCFPSVEAAKAALGSKPPFNTFHPQALHAYLACGGLRPAAAAPSQAAAKCADASTSGSSSCGRLGPWIADGRDQSAGSTVSNGAAGGSCWTLSCTPETEARVYEALDPPPWRPWQLLSRGRPTEGCSAGGCASAAGNCSGGDATSCCDAAGRSGSSSSSNSQSNEKGGNRLSEGNGSSGSSCTKGRSAAAGGCAGSCGECTGGGCRVAVAVGTDAPGLHAQLARWGPQVAALVPGAQVFRFPSLQHLGPMEDPWAVATTARTFFLQPDACAVQGSSGCCAGGSASANDHREDATGYRGSDGLAKPGSCAAASTSEGRRAGPEAGSGGEAAGRQQGGLQLRLTAMPLRSLL